MIEFESKMPVFRNFHERVNRQARTKHDDAELTIFAEGLSGSIDDYDVRRKDMGEVLQEIGDDMCRWDYVTKFTITPKVDVLAKVAG